MALIEFIYLMSCHSWGLFLGGKCERVSANVALARFICSFDTNSGWCLKGKTWHNLKANMASIKFVYWRSFLGVYFRGEEHRQIRWDADKRAGESEGGGYRQDWRQGGRGV